MAPAKAATYGGIATAVTLLVLCLGLGSASLSFRNTLARFGLAATGENAHGIVIGSNPSVFATPAALLAWVGIIVMVSGLCYTAAGLSYNELEQEDMLSDLNAMEAPPQQQGAQPQPGYPPQQMMGYSPQQMMGYPQPGMPHM